LAIAASPSPLETAKEAGYDASKTASQGICPGTPSLQHLHISDLPTTVSRKYAYTADLAIMHADGDW